MASRGNGIASPGSADKITIAIKKLKAVKVKTKSKEYQEIISKLERAIRENEVEDITNYTGKAAIRIQALDVKDMAVKKANKSIEDIRDKYVVAQPSIKGERGLMPGGIKGKKIETKERSTTHEQLPWIAKVVGKFKKWLQEDIDILKDDFEDGCPDEMKEIQTDLVYIRNEMSRRFEKIRNLGHDNTEKLRQLYASLQKPFDEQVKVKKNTTPSSDPDETVVTNIKNLFVDRYIFSREFEESYRVHMAKIKPMLSEMLGKEPDCESSDVKNELHAVQICLSEYRTTTKVLKEIDDGIVELVRYFRDVENTEKKHTWSVTEATQRWKWDIPRCCQDLQTISLSLAKVRENLDIDSSGLADLCKQIQRWTDTLVDAGSIEQELKMMENKLVTQDFKTYSKEVKGRTDFRSASRNFMIGNTGQQMLLQFIKKLTNEIDAILHGQQEKIKRISEEKKALLGRLNEVTERLTKDISTLEADKREAIRRLSKLAVDKMTGNPNIADLSDPNRPTKISECFYSLYDNEWTDAYECTSKTGKPDKDCCELLLNILKESDIFCRQQATAQRKMIMEALIIPSSLKSEKERDSRDVETEEVIDDYLKDMRKSFSSQFIVNLKQVFKPYVKDELRGNKQIQDYAQKCVELCWYMCIQSPPVVMETSGKTGDKFDLEKYRYYVKKGNRIDFFVWPPLLLHEKGPILSKGVAQGN